MNECRHGLQVVDWKGKDSEEQSEWGFSFVVSVDAWEREQRKEEDQTCSDGFIEGRLIVRRRSIKGSEVRKVVKCNGNYSSQTCNQTDGKEHSLQDDISTALSFNHGLWCLSMVSLMMIKSVLKTNCFCWSTFAGGFPSRAFFWHSIRHYLQKDFSWSRESQFILMTPPVMYNK